MKLTDFRQSAYNIKKVKRAWRVAQQSKRGNGKNKEAKIQESHKDYMAVSIKYLSKVEGILPKLDTDMFGSILATQIKVYVCDAKMLLDQIDRRILQGEVIDPSEKIYSIYERHTEWINKGKSNNKIELGLKVCIIEDQYQFILNHRVMQKEMDSDIAVKFTEDSKSKFADINSCSYDKGFYSAANEVNLKEILEKVVMPKKGKLSVERLELERSKDFLKHKHQHSAVESAINCLEHHGLDRCRDKGLFGFKRYVAIAIAAKNVIRIGAILKQQELKKEERRKRKLQKAA